MNKKYFCFAVLFILFFAIFLSGCSTSGIVTPDPSDIGGDAYICENLLKGFYTALSNQNFSQALSYCKTGGVSFKYVNNLWTTAQQYPTFYTTYQVYNVYNFKYVGQYLSLRYDYSYTTHSYYGNTEPNTKYNYDSTMLFEKVNGEWKMS